MSESAADLIAQLRAQHVRSETAAARLEADLARSNSDLALMRESCKQTRAALDAERAARRAFEADCVQLRQAALAYVRAVSYAARERLRAELHVLATVEHPGVLILNEQRKCNLCPADGKRYDLCADCAARFLPPAPHDWREQLASAHEQVVALVAQLATALPWIEAPGVQAEARGVRDAARTWLRDALAVYDEGTK